MCLCPFVNSGQIHSCFTILSVDGHIKSSHPNSPDSCGKLDMNETSLLTSVSLPLCPCTELYDETTYSKLKSALYEIDLAFNYDCGDLLTVWPRGHNQSKAKQGYFMVQTCSQPVYTLLMGRGVGGKGDEWMGDEWRGNRGLRISNYELPQYADTGLFSVLDSKTQFTGLNHCLHV